MIRFTIGVQQSTYERLENELKSLLSNLEKKNEEQSELQEELKQRIPRGELEELN